MKITRFVVALAIVAMQFIACENEKNKNSQNYRYGIFILNEGSYLSNNGSVSFYDPISGKMVNNVFETVNGRPLGDVVQHMGITGNTAYIVVNGSGKVEVVNLESFKTVAEPIIASYPRCFLAVDTVKGYLTNGKMQGCIYIIDLKTFVIKDSVELGTGPSSMMKLNDKVYIANSGGWDLDSTVNIIDIRSDQVIGTIYVGDIPSDMALDHENNLWIYCMGYATYNWDSGELISETEAKLVKINTGTNTVVWEGIVGTAGQYAATSPKLAVSANGEVLYFLRPEGVYKTETANPSVPGELILDGSYYGLDVNPENDDLYLFQSGFTGNGNLFIVNPVTGERVTYTVGIGPNGAVFNLE